MRFISLLLIIFVPLLIFIPSSSAKMVRYVDEQGTIKYVNTEFGTVPPQYRWQVEEQLKEDLPPEETTTVIEQETENFEIPEAENTLDPKEIVVEVLIRVGCENCQKLQLALQANRIRFYAYDVESHPRGIELYEEFKRDVLPIAFIGDRIFRGYRVQPILQYMRHLRKIAPSK